MILAESYDVLIRNNETGEIRRCHMDLPWHDDGDEYWWTEGNFGCDCNRELTWLRAGGVEPDLEEIECSDSRYTALRAILPDGTEIELDSRERDDV